jgi:hypothetical protein
MDETRSERLDAIEAWMAEARVKIDGLNAEMDAGRRGRRLRKKTNRLQSEAEAQLRELDDISRDLRVE